jgi:hypothetical protein
MSDIEKARKLFDKWFRGGRGETREPAAVQRLCSEFCAVYPITLNPV